MAPPGPSRHPATSPPACDGASMAYDAATGAVVLFGGDQQHDRGHLDLGLNHIRMVQTAAPGVEVLAHLADDQGVCATGVMTKSTTPSPLTGDGA